MEACVPAPGSARTGGAGAGISSGAGTGSGGEIGAAAGLGGGAVWPGSMKNVPFEGGVEDMVTFRSGACRLASTSAGSTSANSGVIAWSSAPLKADPFAAESRHLPPGYARL